MLQKPERWALPPVPISTYHSKSASYAAGYSNGFAAAVETLEYDYLYDVDEGWFRRVVGSWEKDPNAQARESVRDE